MGLLVDIEKKLGNFLLKVTFDTEQGVLGLLGASGSGKSITLKCIAGIATPDRGKIVLNGITLFDSERKINLSPQKRKVGYLFQEYALFPHMTVQQNILCGVQGEEKEYQKRVLRTILDEMQLKGLEKHRPCQLSGGQQQRVALARILVNKPEILLLDEPFSALDSHLRSQMQIYIQRVLKQFGKTALVVTHNAAEAYYLCKEIAVIDNGEVLVKKPTKVLFEKPESKQAAILTGCKNIVAAEKTGTHEVYVPAWGVRFQTEEAIKNSLCAIGIRAHSFGESNDENKYRVTITNEVETPFERMVEFCYQNHGEKEQRIWWQTNTLGERTPPRYLGVSRKDILPLYH